MRSCGYGRANMRLRKARGRDRLRWLLISVE
jgi:hypothetical protein